MEKRRMRLEINGVVCGLITRESEEYMQTLAGEVGEMMQEILAASPFVTRESAALTAALGYCDDAKKNGKKAFGLQERVDELEVEAEVWQEDREEILKNSASAQADARLTARVAQLETANTRLEETARAARQLAEQVSRLEDENAALRQFSAEAGETGAAFPGEFSRLEEENRELRKKAGEQAELARKAEQEKHGAVSAAKRAVEEARKVVDQLREEAERAREEARRLKARGASPALDLLERTAEEAGDPAHGERDPGPGSLVRGEQGTGRKPEARKKRKNPLRYEENFEQEGFVSFFEKK